MQGKAFYELYMLKVERVQDTSYIEQGKVGSFTGPADDATRTLPQLPAKIKRKLPIDYISRNCDLATSIIDCPAVHYPDCITGDDSVSVKMRSMIDAISTGTIFVGDEDDMYGLINFMRCLEYGTCYFLQRTMLKEPEAILEDDKIKALENRIKELEKKLKPIVALEKRIKELESRFNSLYNTYFD